MFGVFCSFRGRSLVCCDFTYVAWCRSTKGDSLTDDKSHNRVVWPLNRIRQQILGAGPSSSGDAVHGSISESDYACRQPRDCGLPDLVQDQATFSGMGMWS